MKQKLIKLVIPPSLFLIATILLLTSPAYANELVLRLNLQFNPQVDLSKVSISYISEAAYFKKQCGAWGSVSTALTATPRLNRTALKIDTF
jgi:hypothetical protein